MFFGRARRGFTLIEMLVAMGLVGVVIALALKGFTEMKKITDLTNSRLQAREEAAKAVRTISALLKRSHIVYFNGHPLDAAAPLDLAPLPALLAAEGFGGAMPQVPFAANDAALTVNDVDSAALYPLTPLSDFRFWTDQNAERGPFQDNPVKRLRSRDPIAVAAADEFDTYFSMPLVYFAEANFAQLTPEDIAANFGGQQLTSSYVPVNWTFYVLYLAPMDIRNPGHGALPVRGATEMADRDRGTADGGARWNRSTLPYQLRLLTIPGVAAHQDANAADPVNSANWMDGGTMRPFGRRTYGERNPARADGDNGLLLPAPFDFANGDVNYDPLAIGSAASLDFITATVSPMLNPNTPSGARVNGVAAHANFGQLGNDPPTNDVLGVRLAGVRSTDKVIASWIDPDNVHGTCIRLFNSLATGAERRYYNAYENKPTTAPANVSGFVHRDAAPKPSRALISVATRFRNNRQIPFQFHTETVEVELEALTRFQSTNRTRM